jgi:hypothetical protein
MRSCIQQPEPLMPLVEPAPSALALLALQEPEQLFSSPETVAEGFRALARRWHPDANAQAKAGEVFAHLASLRDAALRKQRLGLWEGQEELRLRTPSGSSRVFKEISRWSFELGRCHLGPGTLVAILNAEWEDFHRNARLLAKACVGREPRLRSAFLGSLPAVREAFPLADGRPVLVLALAPDLIRLRDLFRHLGHRLDPRHVAWIVSGLLNLACYLQRTGLTHNDLSLDTCFVSPRRHFVALPGGWWYGALEGQPLLGLPRRSLDLWPWTSVGDPGLDLELIRAVARELLGDASGQLLPDLGTAPEALGTWARQASSGSAREDYRHWMENILPASFGSRRFVALEITPDQVHGGKA